VRQVILEGFGWRSLAGGVMGSGWGHGGIQVGAKDWGVGEGGVMAGWVRGETRGGGFVVYGRSEGGRGGVIRGPRGVSGRGARGEEWAGGGVSVVSVPRKGDGVSRRRQRTRRREGEPLVVGEFMVLGDRGQQLQGVGGGRGIGGRVDGCFRTTGSRVRGGDRGRGCASRVSLMRGVRRRGGVDVGAVVAGGELCTTAVGGRGCGGGSGWLCWLVTWASDRPGTRSVGSCLSGSHVST